MKKLHTRGFTIIELLIATVIFSLVLLIITGAIIQFSKVYYKGVLTSKTQEVARSIVDEMSRSAQFSKTKSQSPPATNQAWCFGNNRFSYTLKKRLVPGQAVLRTDSAANGSCGYNGGVGTRELMGEGMQLLKLDVIEDAASGQITITAVVAYGADTDINIDNMNPANSSCKALTLGGQYCAISTVTSTVTRRLGN